MGVAPVAVHVVAVIALLAGVHLHDVVAAMGPEAAVPFAAVITTGEDAVVAILETGLHDPVAAIRPYHASG